MFTVYQINQRTGKRRALLTGFSCWDAAERFAIRLTLLGPRGYGYVVRHA